MKRHVIDVDRERIERLTVKNHQMTEASPDVKASLTDSSGDEDVSLPALRIRYTTTCTHHGLSTKLAAREEHIPPLPGE